MLIEFLYFTAQILPGPVPPEVKYRIPSGNKQEVFTLFRVKINWLEADQLAILKKDAEELNSGPRTQICLVAEDSNEDFNQGHPDISIINQMF